MSYATVILVSGSPSTSSRSTTVLDELGRRLEEGGVSTRRYGVRDFDPGELLGADASSARLQAFIQAVKSAQALVVATPVYKATYAGTLKVLLDVLPPEALVGKTALGVATARIAAHFASVERAFTDLFRFFRVDRELTPLLLTDEQVPAQGSEYRLNEAARASASLSARALLDVLQSRALESPTN